MQISSGVTPPEHDRPEPGADPIADADSRWLKEPYSTLPPWPTTEPPVVSRVDTERLLRLIRNEAGEEEADATLALVVEQRCWREAYMRLLTRNADDRPAVG